MIARSGHRLLFLAAMLALLPVFIAESLQRAEPEAPYRLMYGYNDRAREAWLETLGHVNIVTGTTSDGAFVQDLRRRGILFAAHVLSRAEGATTADDTVRAWERPFLDDLGGTLPGGFDAIAIDEIGSRDGTSESKRVCDALRMLKRKYPDRKILVWGGWRMGEPGIFNGQYRDQLSAVIEVAYLLLYEMYLTESRPRFDRFTASARYFDRFDGRLLGKTVYTLYLTQTKPFIADDDETRDYQGLLNREVAMMRRDPLLARCAGIGFWAFYRARADIVHYVNLLLAHYYEQDFGRDIGDALESLVRNAGFEEGTRWWESPTPGAFAVKAYPRGGALPADHGGVSHRRAYLEMRRGESPTRLRQRIPLAPRTWYTLSALMVGGDGGRAAAYGAGGVMLTSIPGESDRWAPWRQVLLTFLTDANGETTIELNDEDAPRGSTTAWDFVELARCAGSNQPPTVDELRILSGRLVLFGSHFLPGGMVLLENQPVSGAAWVDAGRIDLGDAAQWTATTYESEYRKPVSALHAHTVKGRLTVYAGVPP